jgi:hypothetical protein
MTVAPNPTNESSAILEACTLADQGKRCFVAPDNDSKFGSCGGGQCLQSTEGAEPIAADQLVIACSDEGTTTSGVRDGFSCIQEELQIFGTCYKGACRKRCTMPPTGEGQTSASTGCPSDDDGFSGRLAQQTNCHWEETALVGVCIETVER